jgi:lysophospholipase L1-like esterase
MSGVWSDRKRYTLDDIHPNALGSGVIAIKVFRALEPMLERSAAGTGPGTSPR